MNHSTQLPKNFEKALNELARAREKAAKQKYLLDLGESLVMHLCSFVLGEYKATDETFIDLEKSFIKNSKNNTTNNDFEYIYNKFIFFNIIGVFKFIFLQKIINL